VILPGALQDLLEGRIDSTAAQMQHLGFTDDIEGTLAQVSVNELMSWRSNEYFFWPAFWQPGKNSIQPASVGPYGARGKRLWYELITLSHLDNPGNDLLSGPPDRHSHGHHGKTARANFPSGLWRGSDLLFDRRTRPNCSAGSRLTQHSARACD
jgi:hypothetical protein